jgi:hypothetical protein
MILSYIHQKRYERELNQQVNQAADRDDLQIKDIKKTITVENFFLLVQENKMQKDQINEVF